ncbi:MAG: class I SAM-dependent methyltransferase [Clostridiales bacterium]|nr:class I SAM-dependent methyltransferase [Clostridiales bacterium]
MQRLSIRLSSVAALVDTGAAIADVGTDHGFVPVYLAENNIIKSAIALDINSSPLASCKQLVEKQGLQDIIKTRISDGLDSVFENECDTVITVGMGGELIANILQRCKWIKTKHIIAQPMTHPEYVRKFLYENGFDIKNDFIIEDCGHFYCVLDAHYTGNVTAKSRADYFLGNIKDFSKKDYFVHLLNYFYNKSKSGEDYSDIISALEKII